MDAGAIQVAPRVSQGPLAYVPGVGGRMLLESPP